MIKGSLFPDNFERVFIPYKGWQIKTGNGELIKDDILEDPVGPYAIVVDTPSHGNWHTLYNLMDKSGNLMLSKGVRTIVYYQDGYYLLEDNNEDELINRGDVKGGFKASDYREYYNVIRNDGQFISERWFNSIEKDLGFFRVKIEGKPCKIYLSGRIEYIHAFLDFGCQIVSSDDEMYIQNSKGETISPCCSSVMWADKHIWNVHVIHDGKRRTFLHGQSNEIIFYIHEVLILNNTIAIIVKNNVWYKIDSLGKLSEILRYDADSIMSL